MANDFPLGPIPEIRNLDANQISPVLGQLVAAVNAGGIGGPTGSTGPAGPAIGGYLVLPV